MNSPAALKPAPSDWRGRQFSLLVLFLVVLVACVSAAYLGERRRRVAAERGAIQEREEAVRLRKYAGPPQPPSEFAGADPRLVHIKSVQPGIGARDEPGWAWRVYLPEGQWWLYVSQGEEWDEGLGKYRESVSGSQIKDIGELDIYGCLSTDKERSRWIQNWASGANQAARLSDAGLAVLKGSGQATRTVTGFVGQESLPMRPNPHGRIQLFRWHKVLDKDAVADATKSLLGRERPLKEYGFSIYLVEESPKPGPMTKPN